MNLYRSAVIGAARNSVRPRSKQVADYGRVLAVAGPPTLHILGVGRT